MLMEKIEVEKQDISVFASSPMILPSLNILDDSFLELENFLVVIQFSGSNLYIQYDNDESDISAGLENLH